MDILTLKEELLLSALVMHGGSSCGAPLRRTVIEFTQKEMVYGTLYNLMENLIRKGYVASQKGAPTPVQGGRSKTIYSITKEGEAALRETMTKHESIMKSLYGLDFGG